MQQAISETSAATYKLMEPHFLLFLSGDVFVQLIFWSEALKGCRWMSDSYFWPIETNWQQNKNKAEGGNLFLNVKKIWWKDLNVFSWDQFNEEIQWFLHLWLLPAFHSAGLSDTNIRADWLHDWSLAAKWARILITYLDAANPIHQIFKHDEGWASWSNCE